MMTPRLFFEETLPAKLNAEMAASINAVFQFHITGDDGGDWSVDLTAASDWVQPGEAEKADCVLTMKSSDFLGILDRSVNPQMAFMMGKIKVGGNLALSLKLPRILG